LTGKLRGWEEMMPVYQDGGKKEAKGMAQTLKPRIRPRSKENPGKTEGTKESWGHSA